MCNGVDWSNMLPDILAKIISRVEPVDFIRSGAVCRSWRSTICGGSCLCHPKPCQTPWLLLSTPEEADFKFMHNPREPASLYKFYLPSIRNHVIKGSSGGYIITIDDLGRINATNPITKAHRLLPDPTTLSDFHSIVTDPISGKVAYSCYNERLYRGDCLFPFYSKVVIAPDSDGSMMAVLIKSTGVYELAIARENEDSWTEIKETPIYYFYDAIVFKGLLYAVNYLMKIAVFDLHNPPSPKPTFFVKDLPEELSTDDKKYLVESLCGSDVFLLAKYIMYITVDGCDHRRRTTGFKVFKLNQTENEWVQVSSFGDDDVAVFIGYNLSTMRSVVDLPNQVFRKNCIYFTEDYYACDWEAYDKIYCEDTSVYCMESQTVTPFLLDGIDLKRFYYPPPVWFFPTF